MEGRVMGLDVGDARTGIAMSDPLGMVAMPHSVIRSQSAEVDCAAISDLAQKHEVVEIVVGMPLDRNGRIGPQAEKVERFVEQLRRFVSVPVQVQDERFSTASAERSLIQADVSRKRRKQVIDQVAAQQILQVYLDRRSAKAKRGQ